MNRQRKDAYKNLILELLNCNEAEEGIVLYQYIELLDKDLLIVVAEEIDQLKQKGEREAVVWLQGFSEWLERKLRKQIR